MISHRLVAIACVVLCGVCPAAAATPQPVTPPEYRPCPIQPAALAVPTPHSTLPPAPPHKSGDLEIGGVGLATSGLTVPTEAPALPETLGARAWLVADMDTGDVLGACGPHERFAPASIQKLLLAATIMGRLDPQNVVEVTPADLEIEPDSSAVGLLLGGHYSIETLWLGLLLVSGNDAANVLARINGGVEGVSGTIKAMNTLASQLGARNTTALTPHGLDGPGQFTTAYDMALIARACFANEDFRRYTLTQTAQIPPQPPQDPHGFQIQNDNTLIYNYQGALGGKTGFTDIARHSYVGAAERNGRRLIVTVLGAEIISQRVWAQGAALLDWGFGIPNTSAVGRLITEEERDTSTSPTPYVANPNPVELQRPATSSTNPSTSPTLTAASFSLIIVAIIALFMSVLRTRRQASTLAGADQQRRKHGSSETMRHDVPIEKPWSEVRKAGQK